MLLNKEAINQFRAQVDKKTVTYSDITSSLEPFRNAQLSQEQQDLVDAITNELQQDRLRKVVLLSLIKPFRSSFSKTPLEADAKTLANLVWFYIHSQ